jgi:polar amino acid transport system permease protein
MIIASGYTWEWGVIWEAFPFLLQGILVTLKVVGLAIVVMIPVALTVYLARVSRWLPLKVLGSLYLDVFRSVPFLVQLFFVFFGLPIAFGVVFTPVQAAVGTLACYMASYQAETFRAAMASVRPGQWEAGAALGMTRFQQIRRIAFPQALLLMIPPTVNNIVQLVKEAVVVSAVSVPDVLWRAQNIASLNFHVAEPFTFVGAFYLILIIPVSLGARMLHRRLVAGYER